MKRSTAVGHLREMAGAASDGLRLRDSEIGWPLEELWVAGALLDDVDALDHGAVVLSLDVEPAELTWLAIHPTGEWVGHELRLGKRPFSWVYRPVLWPPWNPVHQRVVRFWSARDGADEDAIGALHDCRFGDLAAIEPSRAEMSEQFEAELAESRRHLGDVLDKYWDQEWRRDHRSGEGPEDHLWRAAEAVRGLERMLA